MKPKSLILLTALLLTALLCAAPVAADAVTHNGKTYTTYDQIYASTTLSSSEKLSLVQEMAGWTEELAAYMEWKNSGGLEAYQANITGGNTSDYGWDEAPGDGLGDGGNIEPEYSYQERQAYDAAYDAYQAEFAAGYNYARATGAAGSGTQADPYQITSASDLAAVTSGYYYAFTQDITLTNDISTILSPTEINGNGFSLDFNGYVLTFSGVDSNTQTTLKQIKFINPKPYDEGVIKTNCIVYDCVISDVSINSDGWNSVFSQSNIINNVFIESGTLKNTGNQWATWQASSFVLTNSAGNQNVKVYNSVSALESVSGKNNAGRIITPNYMSSSSVVSNCYALNTMLVQGSTVTSSNPNSYNGADVTQTQLNTESWWKTTMSMWDWENVWQWNSETNLPELRNANNQAVPPTISSITATPSIGGQQDTYTLSVSASTTAAGGIASYQWYGRIGSSGEWQAITDGTSATYQFVPGAYAIGDFYFKCVITGADGGVVDSYDAGYTFVKVTVVLAPQITSPAATPATGPLSQTVQLSASVTSTETVTYQWQELIGSTWTDISGATAATATVNIADSAATTHSYRLLATNIGGTTTSDTVTYTSVAPPAISSVTANPTTGPLTQSVTLSATVSGATSYQWQKLSGSTWQNIAGATSATYTANIADSAATTHSYRLLATNVGGTTTSATVTYTSVAPPTISSVTANPTTGPLTQSVTLSATVSGATSYQWQKLSGSTWQNIAGATSATYTANIADSAATTHSYRLLATNVGGTTTSATVTYTSVAPPTISSVSANPTSGPLTQSVTLSATVSGATSYQWQEQIGGNWQNIAGATSATYTANIADSAATTHSYRLLATNVGGTTTSATVTYTSVLPPTINTVSATPASGPLSQTVTLTVSATGAAQYQWQQLTGTTWNNINGATASTHTVTISDNAPTLHSYRVVVSNVGGSITSDTVTYQSSQGPLITNAAANPTTGPLTQTVQLTTTVTSDYAITYQWQEYKSNTWQDISGAESASVSVNVADSVPTLHQYRLLATDIGGTTPSAVVTYQSVAPPVFDSVSVTPSQGTYSATVQLTATVSGADSLQWQELVSGNWQNISGATSAAYSLTLSDQAATLHSYRLMAINVGGSSYSSTVTYQSVAPPVFSSVSVTPASGAMPLTVSFSAEASDTSGYRWEYSTGGTVWMQMASGASGSYTFTDAGTYSVRVVATGTGGQSYSDVVSVSVIDYTPVFESVSVSPTAGVVPFSVTFTASATNSPDYVWEQRQGNSWVAVGFGSPFTLSIPYGTETGTLSFRAQASNDYGVAVSEILTVSVGAPPRAEIVTPVEGATAAVNRAVSFSAYSAPGVAYSWDFGDGSSGSGSTVTHYYSEEGMYSVTLTATNQYGSSTDSMHLYVIVPTGEIFVTVTDVSSSGAELTATVETTPVDAGTLVWFELESMSGQSVYKSPQLQYSGPVSYTASGLPLLAGQTYRAIAYSNYYGYSIPVQVTLVDAVQAPHETLGIAWNNGLNREPFNVSALVAAGVGVFGGALGGGAVGAAVSFGVIAMFVLVGLWLRQQDIVVPLTLTLIAGWFVIGNLPGDWQPIAYTLMVVCVVAIFFYLFRKRIE